MLAQPLGCDLDIPVYGASIFNWNIRIELESGIR